MNAPALITRAEPRIAHAGNLRFTRNGRLLSIAFYEGAHLWSGPEIFAAPSGRYLFIRRKQMVWAETLVQLLALLRDFRGELAYIRGCERRAEADYA